MRTFCIVVASALGATALAGQQSPGTVHGDAALVWSRNDSGGQSSIVRGFVAGGEARLPIGRLIVGGGYREGALQPVSGTSAGRDLAEGWLFLGGKPWHWLELTAGPFIRTYTVDLSTERWVLWQVRARAEAPIEGLRLTSYVEFWRAFGERAEPAIAAGRVQGGEAGVVWRALPNPIWLRLGYRVDDALMNGGSRSETMEGITLTVGVGDR
ncbi:MAG TPA: hypothetical protein VFI39_06585 [Gemmatimonadales bacterium]|nr:hypothetical protein [Gemmatimonadales bacterium]